MLIRTRPQLEPDYAQSVDIRDYSIHPNSGNDVTSEVNAALLELVNGARVDRDVFFPAGEYLVSQIDIPARGCHILGEGSHMDTRLANVGTRFKSDGTSTGGVIRAVESEMQGGADLVDTRISNIQIDGGMSANGDTKVTGIYLDSDNNSSSGIALRNIGIVNVNRGIIADGLFSSSFRDIKISELWGFNGEGIECNTGGLCCVAENVWVSEGLNNGSFSGFVLDSGWWILISCNGLDTSRDSSHWGLIRGSNTYARLVGCNVENPGWNYGTHNRGAIEVDTGARVSLEGVRFWLTDQTDYMPIKVNSGCKCTVDASTQILNDLSPGSTTLHTSGGDTICADVHADGEFSVKDGSNLSGLHVLIGGSTKRSVTDFGKNYGARSFHRVNSLGNLGTAVAIDFAEATHFEGTLDDNVTITHSNETEGQEVVLYLAYDGSAQRTITWSDVDKWEGGSAPTAPNASGEVLIVRIKFVGGTAYGSSVTAS